MNQEYNQQPPFLNQQQPVYHYYNFKSEPNDKTTHQPSEQDYQPRHPFQFLQRSPFRPSSFFFTPTSPKHFHLDISSNDLSKSALKLQSTGVSICRKMNLGLEQEQESENQEIQEGLKESKAKKGTPNRSIKNSKGLRSLSQSVYMIVSQLGKTKYKIVAERLIADIIKNGEPFDKSKDEHNVKRRVYDALNVLIAAGMLQKHGKEVLCNQPYQQESMLAKSENSRQIIEKQKLQEQLKNKADLMHKKKIMLQELKQKKQNIQKIILRNKRESHFQQDILRFPLIGTFIEQKRTQGLQLVGNQIIFQFPHLPVLLGDVDLLVRVKQPSPLKQESEPENIYNVIIKEEEQESERLWEVKMQAEVKIQDPSREYVKTE